MSSRPHTAFLSYSSVYRDWVVVLQENLEAALDHLGRPGQISLDQLDLDPGHSWVSQLSAFVDQAAKLVLVVTPEALASRWVEAEWQGLLSSRRTWRQGQLVPVQLVWAPLPVFLGPIQHIDFQGHDDDSYAAELRKLVGALLGLKPRESRKLTLPPGLRCPVAPVPGLAEDRRRALIAWLKPEMAHDDRRGELGRILGREVAEPEQYGGIDAAASALLVEVGRDSGGEAAGADALVRSLLDGLNLDTTRREVLEGLLGP